MLSQQIFVIYNIMLTITFCIDDDDKNDDFRFNPCPAFETVQIQISLLLKKPTDLDCCFR